MNKAGESQPIKIIDEIDESIRYVDTIFLITEYIFMFLTANFKEIRVSQFIRMFVYFLNYMLKLYLHLL